MDRTQQLIPRELTQLNPFAGSLTGEELLPIYDPITGKTLRLKTSEIRGGDDKTQQWLSTETYTTGDIRAWNLKFWKSLVDDNLNHQPVEGAFWTEVSKSESGNLGYWAAGVFTVDPTVVFYGGQMYLLNTNTESGGVTMPYESTNFVTELAAGKWILIGQGAEAAHWSVEIASRDFTPDGFENNTIYACNPGGGDLTMTLPAPTTPLGNTAISAQFLLIGPGTVTILSPGYLIGGQTQQVINFINTSLTIVESGGYYYVTQDSRPKTINTTLISYPLSEDSTITDPLTSTFFKQRCLTIEDSRFNPDTAVSSSGAVTANPTDPYQLLNSSISDENTIVGEVPEGALTLFINAYRTGAININLYVQYFKREIGGTETLIATSNVIQINTVTISQYQAVAAHSEFTMISTDRIAVRLYGRKAATGVDPQLTATVEGPNPTRSIIEVAQNTVPHGALPGRNAEFQHNTESVYSEDALPNIGTSANEKLSVILASIGLVSKTYAELAAMVAANTLVQGKKYLLTDYATKHVIPNSSPVVINTGTTEPIILTAANDHEFHTEVISTLFPSDIIRYRFDDDSCEDGTRDAVNKKWTGGTARPGYINYRKSTTNNLEVHNDWRNYKVRRWKLDCAAWVSAASYTKMDVAKGSDGNIYVAKTTHSGLTTNPVSDTTNWQLAFDLTIQTSGGFLSFTPVKADFTIGGITPDNLIINNTTPGTDYQDYYQFCILTELTNSSGLLISNTYLSQGQGYNNYSVGLYDYESFNTIYGDGNDLESNVFFVRPNGIRERQLLYNIYGGGMTYNTIIDEHYSNTVGNGMHKNIINYNFYANKIGDGCHSNTLTNNYISNVIKDEYNSNIIGAYCVSNKIDNACNSNIIGGGFYSNTIGIGYANNTIKYGYQFNTACIDVINVDFTSATHVYSNYECTIFNNSSATLRLSYYNASDVLTVVDPTA